MKYHLIPVSDVSKKKNNVHLSKTVVQTATELSKEALLSIKKTNKRQPGICSSNCYYLYDEESMHTLMKNLCKSDEIIVHGEGMPFVLGLSEPSCYDLHGQSFAKLLHEYKMPDIELNIKLLSCQTASTYSPEDDTSIDINFARDMSKALQFFGYKHVKVTGYTGFVVAKKGGAYSVSSVLDNSKNARGTHSSLEGAQIVYLNGEAILKGRTMTTNLSDMSFGWAKEYIKKAIVGQQSILPKEPLTPQNQIEKYPSLLMCSFFNAQSDKENEGTESIESIRAGASVI